MGSIHLTQPQRHWRKILYESAAIVNKGTARHVGRFSLGRRVYCILTDSFLLSVFPFYYYPIHHTAALQYTTMQTLVLREYSQIAMVFRYQITFPKFMHYLFWWKLLKMVISSMGTTCLSRMTHTGRGTGKRVFGDRCYRGSCVDKSMPFFVRLWSN